MVRRIAGKPSREALQIEEVQAAYTELLRQKEEEKREFECSVLGNVRNLVLPYVERLKSSGLTREQQTFVNILESNLSGITTQLGGNNPNRRLDLQLTPTEIRIACLIRDGLTTREIARVMNASKNTILFHRFNIRSKLQIKGKKCNLRSYLQALH